MVRQRRSLWIRKKFVVYDELNKTTTSMYKETFQYEKTRNASRIIREIIQCRLPKDYIYICSYRYKLKDVGWCGVICEKQFLPEEYEVFEKMLKSKYKNVTIDIIDGAKL